MRILHTSDWHIGRTFFGESVYQELETVLAQLVELVRDHDVDVVVIAGDIFDSTMPAAAAFDFLTDQLVALHATGAKVVLTSGNHDSAARLRFQSLWAKVSGIHVIADPELGFESVEFADEHGPVRVYGVPYLEPALIRHLEGAREVRTQADAMRWATDAARAEHERGGGRSVLVGHCFAAGVPEVAHATDIERDLTAGGLDVVPLSVFDGFDYVALGHIHGRAELAPHIRYSGAPLHYSFSERNSPRGCWLVDLDATGFAGAAWLSLPVPRELSHLEDTIDNLLERAEYTGAQDHWVRAALTDQRRPVDAMMRLRTRFPFAVHVEHRPSTRAESIDNYRARIAKAATDEQRVDEFLQHTRNGVGVSEIEREIVSEALAQQRVTEATK